MENTLRIFIHDGRLEQSVRKLGKKLRFNGLFTTILAIALLAEQGRINILEKRVEDLEESQKMQTA